VEPLAITTRKNDGLAKLGACLSPNSKYVVTASEDNEVLIFDYKHSSGGVATGGAHLTAVLPGHVAPIGSIAYNPKYDLIATGCVNTVLWIPKEQ
jgi:WD40 repeat protein